jgi:hypothetical protein
VKGGRALGGAILVLVALLTGPVPAAVARPDRQDTDPTLVLTDQTAGVEVGGVLDLGVLPSGIVDGATLRATVHDRVRSRSELAAAAKGQRLRRALHTVSVPIAGLPADAAGARHLAIDLGAATDAGRAIVTPGVYPIELDAVTPGGVAVAGLVTDLVLLPPAAAATPPLDVAVLARIDAPPRTARQPAVAPRTVLDAQRLVSSLAAVPDVVATLAVRPETLESIAASTAEDATGLLAALRSLAAGRPVLALPYVASSPDGLAAAGVAEELPRLLDRGDDVLARLLGTAPTQTAWLADADLGGAGLTLLAALGRHRALVQADQVDGVTDGLLSPARPFLLAPPRQTRRGTGTTTTVDSPSGTADRDDGIDALVIDDRVAADLESHAEPALVASRTLADLAMLWFEQPGTRRAVVVPIDAEVHPAATLAVLQGLRAPALYRTVAVDDAFEEAAPLVDGSGDPVRHRLVPGRTMSLSASLVDGIRSARALRGSAAGMVGATSPLLTELDDHVLRALARELDATQRHGALDAARGVITRLADAIDTPGQVTITLTAREGTVPLTIRNDTGVPIQAQVRVRSPRVELPDGDTIPVTLTEPATRLDIAVRTRTSGAFPFEVEVTSPDGNVSLASTRYSVRSTAVSGVGVVLSAGAGLFLIIWWARHWREARRSAKLVGSPHPAVSSARPRDPG